MTVQCVDCQHWAPKTTPDRQMVKHGFANCDLRSISKGHCYSATYQRECEQFSEAPAPIIKARRRFIDKPSKGSV